MNTMIKIILLSLIGTPGALLDGETAAGRDAEIRILPDVSAPGSAEPNLSRGPAGSVVLSWIEPDGDAHALRYAELGHERWSAPKTVARGDGWFVNWADFPSVVPIDGPLWAAHWLVKRPGGTYAYDVAIAVSTDRGQSWGEPVAPHRDGTATEHGFVSLFPADSGVGALWLDGRNMAESGDHSGNDGGMTLRSAVITADGTVEDRRLVDGLVCDCCQTDVAIGASGPVAVYRNRTTDEVRDIYITRLLDDAWEPGRAVADDGWEIAGCPVNGPVVEADGQRVEVAWFTGAGGETAVRFARSRDGAASFGDPVTIAVERPIGRVGLALLDDGGALVSWIRKQEGNAAQLVTRRVTADGNPAEETVIASLAAGRMSGVPQMVRHGDGVVLAWTERSGDTTQIRSARYTPNP